MGRHKGAARVFENHSNNDSAGLATNGTPAKRAGINVPCTIYVNHVNDVLYTDCYGLSTVPTHIFAGMILS